MGNIAQWLAPVLALIAWPAAVVLVVLAALVLTPREQRPAVLAGIADVIRAARGKDTAPPSPLVPASRASAIEQNRDPIDAPDPAGAEDALRQRGETPRLASAVGCTFLMATDHRHRDWSGRVADTRPNGPAAI